MSQAGISSLRIVPPGMVVETLTGNSGGPVGPDLMSNINVIGSGTVDVVGDPGTNTLTISVSGAVAIQFDEDSGSAVPALGIVNVLGGNNIVTSGAGNTITIDVNGTTNHALQLGNSTGSLTSLGVALNGQLPIGSTGLDPVLSTLTAGTGISISNNPGSITIATASAVALSFPTDSGTATPSSGILNILGGTSGRDINTSGSGNTVHVDLKNAITLGDLSNITGSSALTLTTGDAVITAGVLKLSATNSSGTVGIIEYVGNKFIHSFGDRCAWIGQDAGNLSATNADDNNGHGYQALSALTTGDKNNALGNQAGLVLTSGENNNFMGYQAAKNLVSGVNNVIIGQQSGFAYTGAESSNILITSLGVLGESNTIRIGTSGSGIGQQNRAFIVGIDGVNVGSVAKVVTMASDQLGTATITAGTGISVTPGANTITIATIGGGFAWSVITADQTAVVENGYFCNKAGTLALALPAASAIGDTIEVTNENTALGVQFTQAAGQQILIGNTNTTLGATGTLTSSAVGDTLTIVCKTANTIWRVTSMVGNWTPV